MKPYGTNTKDDDNQDLNKDKKCLCHGKKSCPDEKRIRRRRERKRARREGKRELEDW